MRKHRPIIFDSTERPRTYNFSDLTGAKFSALTVVAFAGKRHSRSYWLCRCDCGGESVLAACDLNSGRVKSCGCLQAAVTAARNTSMAIHGQRDTTEYKTWDGMKQRCYNPKHGGYKYCGALGVIICEKWRLSFAAFLADMGCKPTPQHSIDRFPDPWGNYEPSNCRWATRSQQQRNRRDNAPQGAANVSA